MLDPAQIILEIGIQREPTCDLTLGTTSVHRKAIMPPVLPNCRGGRPTPVSLKSILRISSTYLELPAQATYA
jgi:hypothetical protein